MTRDFKIFRPSFRQNRAALVKSVTLMINNPASIPVFRQNAKIHFGGLDRRKTKCYTWDTQIKKREVVSMKKSVQMMSMSMMRMDSMCICFCASYFHTAFQDSRN